MRSSQFSAACGAFLSMYVLAAAAQTGTPQAPSGPAAMWKAECASCHMSYPPGLLPERSWRKMMAELDQHFGQNASLDAAATKAILGYLVENSAERGTSRRSARFLGAVPATATPLRITRTPISSGNIVKLRPTSGNSQKSEVPQTATLAIPTPRKGVFPDAT